MRERNRVSFKSLLLWHKESNPAKDNCSQATGWASGAVWTQSTRQKPLPRLRIETVLSGYWWVVLLCGISIGTVGQSVLNPEFVSCLLSCNDKTASDCSEYVVARSRQGMVFLMKVWEESLQHVTVASQRFAICKKMVTHGQHSKCTDYKTLVHKPEIERPFWSMPGRGIILKCIFNKLRKGRRGFYSLMIMNNGGLLWADREMMGSIKRGEFQG